MNDKENIRIQILLTGNELMSGVTVDSNSARIAEKFSGIGMSILRKVTVGDELEMLIEEIKTLSTQSDVLLINGGLGPTRDDLTAEALAQACHTALEKNESAYAHLVSWCDRLNSKLNAANLKQVYLPKGADILENPIGSAVGFCMTLNDCLILCTPGVPSELDAMLDTAILPLLKQRFPFAKTRLVERFHLFGIGEATLQQKIDDAIVNWPKTVELSFRAGAPTLEIKLSTQTALHNEDKNQCRAYLYDLFGDYIVAEGSDTLASTLVNLLKEKNKKITFAESCTGGKMASLLTEVAGASEVFESAFVTYSNDSKAKMIQVAQQTLKQYGAVSEQVATEMLLGALQKSGADFGVTVSGIAGPTGGSKDKPVGTVCIAWGSKVSHKSCTLLMPRSRSMFQLMVAATGLDLMRRQLMHISETPRYFGRIHIKH